MESTAIATTQRGEIMESVIIKGDLTKLLPEERAQYYTQVCQSIGLNPLTKPFEYITLNGKLTLYARKDATDQLRNIKGVSVSIAGRERIDDVYLVTALARTPDGRTDESIGAVAIAGLRGDALANAFMKAETKAKRRVTLSICGLGMLDETELETIPQSAIEKPPAIAQESRTTGDLTKGKGQAAPAAEKPATANQGPNQAAFVAIWKRLRAIGIADMEVQEQIKELADGRNFGQVAKDADAEGTFAALIPHFESWAQREEHLFTQENSEAAAG